MRRRIAVALVVSGLVVACSTQVDRVTVGPADPGATTAPDTSGSSASATTAPSTSATTAAPTTAPVPMAKALADAPAIQVAGPRAAQEYDGFVAQVVIDLEAFWTTAYPTIAGGAPYEPLAGGIWPVFPEADGVPGCGAGRTSYPEVEDNAFYCPDEDFIAFDDRVLFPRLEAEFGRFTVAMVLAHEWGHAIQARLGSSLAGVITELQADCFAGAWMDRVRAGDAAGLQLTDTDLRLAITGILEFRDSPGTTADDTGAHGSAFDRLGSFFDGLEGRLTACDAYGVAPPVVLELPFNTIEEAENQGDLPLENLVASVPADLDRFWIELLGRAGTPFEALAGSVQRYPVGGPYPRCGGLAASDFEQGVVYCPSPEFVAYEEGGTNARLHATIGDFSVGVLFADRWAEALQHRLGLSTESTTAALQRDCLTGVWVADLVPRPTRAQSFSISPGDLDEAVQTYLLFTEDSDEAAEAALARIGSFREGVFSGLDSCGL